MSRNQSTPNAPPPAAAVPRPVRHLNQKELAERWNVSPRTLERWRWVGEGPQFLKLGGRVIYRLTDVETYEAEQLRDSTAASAPVQPA